MIRNTKGFTLIELMVVILIIGILAALAIPKFTNASAKAKVAELPTIMAAYDNAQTARVAETGSVGTLAQLVFDAPQDLDAGTAGAQTKWMSYVATDPANQGDNGVYTATARTKIGVLAQGDGGSTTVSGAAANLGTITHAGVGGSGPTALAQYTPNFLP